MEVVTLGDGGADVQGLLERHVDEESFGGRVHRLTRELSGTADGDVDLTYLTLMALLARAVLDAGSSSYVSA